MTITAWAIKAPDGEIIGIGRKASMIDEGDLEMGYRCVKVHITEAQE